MIVTVGFLTNLTDYSVKVYNYRNLHTIKKYYKSTHHYKQTPHYRPFLTTHLKKTMILITKKGKLTIKTNTNHVTHFMSFIDDLETS